MIAIARALAAALALLLALVLPASASTARSPAVGDGTSLASGPHRAPPHSISAVDEPIGRARPDLGGSQAHTYFVSASASAPAVWVHNACTMPGPHPDWATKGAHLKVELPRAIEGERVVELSVRPTGGMGGSLIKLESPFSSTPKKAVDAAIKIATEEIETSPALRALIDRKAAAAQEMFKGKGAAAEMKFLRDAMKKMGGG